MNILIVLYGGELTGVCLVKRKEVLFEIENEVNHSFPKEMVNCILLKGGFNNSQLDYVAFVGKPFTYFERLINLHTYFFPFSFLNFFLDLKDFFGNKLTIKKILKENLGFEKRVCYIELTDALCWQVAENYPDNELTMIAIFPFSMSIRAGGIYEKRKECLFLKREFVYPEKFLILWESLKSIKNSGVKKRLKKTFYYPYRGRVYLKRRYQEIVDKMYIFNLWKEELKKIILENVDLKCKILLISNTTLPSEWTSILKSEIENLELKILDKNEIIKFIANYTLKALFQKNGRRE